MLSTIGNKLHADIYHLETSQLWACFSPPVYRFKPADARRYGYSYQYDSYHGERKS
jgi:hypothetical protein